MAYELAFALTGEGKNLEGALQRATAEEQGLAESADQLTQSHLRWNEAAQRFVSQNNRFVSSLRAGTELREELNALGIVTTSQIQQEIKQLEILEKAYQDDALAVAQLSERKEMLNQRLVGAESGMRSVTGATSNANQAIFTLGDATQDVGIAFSQGASFGDSFGNAVRFAGNNVAFMAEQMALLRTQAGGTTAALNALKASIFGVGGIILGVQLLVALGPQIVSLFSDTADEAERLADQKDDIASLVDGLIRIDERGRQRDFVVPAGRLDEAIRSAERRIRVIRDLLDVAPEELGLIDPRAWDRLVPAAQELARELGAQHDTIGITQEMVRERLDAAQSILETLTQQHDEQKELNRLARELGLINATAVTQLTKALDKRSDLREELEFLQTAEGRRLMEIERQNRALQDQIDFTRELARRGTLLPPDALQFEGGGEQLIRGPGVDFVSPDDLVETELEALNRRFEEQTRYYTRLDDLRQFNAERHRIMLDKMGMNQTQWLTQTMQGLTLLEQMSATTFGGMADLFRSFAEAGEEGNKRAFAAYKAFAIAEAITSTYVAANKALASAPPPFNYILMAGVIAQGLANVQRIRSQQLQESGDQEFMFRPVPSGGRRTPPGRRTTNAPSINAPAPPRPARPATASSASGQWVQRSTVVLPGGDIEIALERRQHELER